MIGNQEADILEEDTGLGVGVSDEPELEEIQVDIDEGEDAGLEADLEEDAEEESNSSSLNDVFAGASAGLVNGMTSTADLAIDIANTIDDKILGDIWSNTSVRKIKDTLDVSDNIAEFLGADENSTAFKVSRGIGEGLVVGLQLMTGVGALAQGAKVGKALSKAALGGVATKGGREALKAGAKAVNSGSKVARTAKAGAVVAGEEILSRESGNERGFIVSQFIDDSLNEQDNKDVDTIMRSTLDNMGRLDEGTANAAMAYLSVNPKAEQDSYERLKNRLENIVDGAAFGAATSTVINAGLKMFKAIKATRVNANRAKDVLQDDAAVLSEVNKRVQKGEEVTEEVKSQIRKEVEEARKAKKRSQLTPEEANKVIDRRILGDLETMDKMAIKHNEALEFFDDAGVTAAFDKFGKGMELSVDDQKAVKNMVRGLARMPKLTEKKRRFFKELETRNVSEILEDPKTVQKLYKNHVAVKETLEETNTQIISDMGKLKAKMHKDMVETGEIAREDILKEMRLREIGVAITTKSKSLDSFAGQALRLAKVHKNNQLPELTRLVDLHRQRNRWKSSSPEFLEFESKVYSDPKGMAEFLGDSSNFAPLSKPEKLMAAAMKGEDFMFDFFRQHLLFSVKGTVRNTLEGTVLSAGRVAKDTLGEGLSQFTKNPIKFGTALSSMQSALGKETRDLAMRNMKEAFRSGDVASQAKVGASMLMETAKKDGTTWEKIKYVTSLGRRAVVAGDKLISTHNEAYFILKNANIKVQQFSENPDLLTKVLKSIDDPNYKIGQDELDLMNDLSSSGIDIRKAAQNYQSFDGDLGKLTSYLHNTMMQNGSFVEGAKKYASKIAMNSEVEDLGALARGFAPLFEKIGEKPFLRWFAPFPKPALSAMDEAIEWTPILNVARNWKRLETGTPQEKMESLAMLGMTSAGAASFWGLMNEGFIQGSGPKDMNARKAWLAAGNKPYSLKIGDQSISMQGTTFGTVATILTDIYDLSAQTFDGSVKDEERAGHLTAGAVGILSELPRNFWTDSLDPLLKMLKAEAVGEKSAQLAMATTLNNMVKGVPVVGLGIQAAGQVKTVTNSDQLDTTTNKTGIDGVLTRAWNEFRKNMVLTDVPKRKSFITGETLGTGREWGKGAILSMKSFKDSQFKDVGDYLTDLMQSRGYKTDLSKKDYLRFTEPQRSITVEGLPNDSYKLSADEYERLTELTAKPEGLPPMVDAIREIMSNFPLEEAKTQREKDVIVGTIKETMKTYKNIAREQFKESSDEYQAHYQESLIKEQDRQEKSISIR